MGPPRRAKFFILHSAPRNAWAAERGACRLVNTEAEETASDEERESDVTAIIGVSRSHQPAYCSQIRLSVTPGYRTCRTETRERSMKTFLALHKIASQRGDGLKSELARLLESAASAARTSSDVLSQTASYLTIDEHNIVAEQDNSLHET